MKIWKQGISALLSVLMLLSALPTAWATVEFEKRPEIQNNGGYTESHESADEERAPSWDEPGTADMEGSDLGTDENAPVDMWDSDLGMDENAPIQDEEPETETFEMPDYGKNEQPAVIEIAEGEVAFNLEDMPVTVGNDTEKANDEDQMYMLFGEDGNFTIDLDQLWHSELFFPFEVQFTYGGTTTEEWFMDPGDTVEIGGHVFSLNTTQTVEGNIRQIGAWVGDTYIPAYPKKKEFSNEPKISMFSLLPLEEKEFYLDMSDAILPMESRIELSTIVDKSDEGDNKISVDGKSVVWVTKEDKYLHTDHPETALIDVGHYSTSLELIAGTVDQLDMTNTRYKVRINRHTDADDALQWAVTSGGQPMKFNSEFYLPYTNLSFTTWYIRVVKFDDIKLGLSLKEPYNAQEVSQGGSAQIKIYKSNYKAVDQLEDPYTLPEDADDVTSTFWSTDAKYEYSNDMSERFLMQIMRNGKCTGMVKFWPNLVRDQLLNPDNSTYFREAGSGWNMVADEDPWIWIGSTYMHDTVHNQNTNMELAVRFEPTSVLSYDDVEKVVEGNYGTADAIRDSSIPDISNKLLCQEDFNKSEDDPNWYVGVFNEKKLFTLLTKDGRIFDFGIIAVGGITGDNIGCCGLYNSDGTAAVSSNYSSRDKVTNISAGVDSLDGGYRILLQYDEENTKTNSIDHLTGSDAQKKIEKAVKGTYATLDEASGQTDIKGQLFADSAADGYLISDADTEFTVFGTDKNVYSVKVNLSLPSSTYFSAYGFAYAESEGGTTKPYGVYRVTSDNDSYYKNGYQTLLVLKGIPSSSTPQESVPADEMGKMKLTFSANESEKIIAENGGIQESGKSEQDYSTATGQVKYSASAGDNEHARNYYVTAKTQDTSGSKLFVNGPQDKREVFLVDQYNNHHDIFIANIGNADLTGLKVELTGKDGTGSAKYVALDDYWTIGETTTLEPFTSTRGTDPDGSTTFSDYLPNIAKIRLVTPEGLDDGGAVEGKLTISADDSKGGRQSVSIELDGFAGNPRITSESVPKGVKYVVYNAMLFNDNMYNWITPEFRITGGKLPDGLTLAKNGQLYGVPKETGTFEFSVQADFKVNQSTAKSILGQEVTFDPDTASFTLEILDNTDDNVEGTLGIDEGYELSVRLEDYTNENYEDRELESEGSFDEFVTLYLDGNELERDVDYTAEQGSTKITLKAATARRAGTGTHTLSARFNQGSQYQVRRTSQNYNSTPRRIISNNSNNSSRPYIGSSSSGSSSGSSRTSSGSTYIPVTPPTPPAPPAPVEHEITVLKAEHGSVTLDKTKAKKDDTVTMTTVPDKNFQITMVVVKDKDGKAIPITKVDENKYSFVMPDSQVTVSTTFNTINPEVSPEERDERTPFTDVNKNRWYADAVAYVYEHGLMQGISESSFAPNSTTSRSMMVTTLYRMAGEPEATGENFPDVQFSTWYSSAASWAKQAGVFTGYADGRLGIKDDIAREQVVSVLMRYAEMQGVDVSTTNDMAEFSDNGMISPYARKAFGWAVENGIIQGNGKGILNPLGNATRAEIAAILMRADQKFDGEINKMNAENDENEDGTNDKAGADGDTDVDNQGNDAE